MPNRFAPQRLLPGRSIMALPSCLLLGAVVGACTGEIGNSTNPPNMTMTGGTGGTSNPGTGGSAGAGMATGQGGAMAAGGTGGTATGGTGAGAGASGSAGMGEDPYVIPEKPPEPVVPPSSRVSRLSRKQWSNCVRDLLKLTDFADIDNGVSGDAVTGFDNEGNVLFVTEQLRLQLAEAAEKLADRVTGDDAALARIVPANAPADVAGRANAFITAFGLRAFRRPLTDAEVTSHLALFNQGPTLYPGVDAFKAGASLVIQAILQSPHFLYRTELGVGDAGATKVPLDDYERSAKLALAITNTMPDDELLGAAAAGRLRDAAGVGTEVQRLLDSAQGTEGIGNFNFQIYRLGAYDGVHREASKYPEFTAETPAAMKREVLEFINWIFRDSRGVRDFFTTSVGFVNSNLAPLYGVQGTFTPDTFTKVDLDPTQRSGLLTQIGFLSSYSNVDDPDIIHRGVHIATRLLCVTLPPPSPRATPLIDLGPDMTNRERVELTTGKGTCGEDCHLPLLNPLGNAFENYDIIGKYRTIDHGKPVNAADIYALDDEMRPFNNGIELSHLLADAKQTHHCYIGNMMSYLHGRQLAQEEAPTVDYYARLSRAGMVSLRNLEQTILTSEAFLTRLP
jgi:hypothetical protein